jgi:uncharacterized protein YkwD
VKLLLSKLGLTKIVAILLVVIIAVGCIGIGYFVGTQLGSPNASPTPSPSITPTPTPTPTSTPTPSPTPTPTPTPTATPTPTPAPTPTPTATPTPTPTPTPAPTNNSQEELVNYALFLINSDRNGLSVHPNGTTIMWVPRINESYPQNVSLSSIGSAQQHAEDMLENSYFSHWDTNGFKPYMRYTVAGGQGSVSENVAWIKFGSYYDLKDAIAVLEFSMMNEDADWNWGHRDNILGSFHNKVSIGIAYNSSDLYLVQDFEDNYVSWSTLSVSNSGVAMKGTITKSGLSISQVQIQYDNITNLTPQQLENSPFNGGYDVGTYVGLVVPAGWQATEGITITATTWSQTGSNFDIAFDLSPAFAKCGKGVYTLYLWTDSNTCLTSLSIWN